MLQKLKQKIELKEGLSTFNLVIPENVEGKIRYLCDKFPTTEWSGILFYKINGSFEDIDNLEFTCVDIYVMNVGNPGFTEFDDSEDIISYRATHADTLLQEGIYEGLIHSHHSMSAFFSGTDSDTLGQEGSQVNHFLSLIVNNEGKYVARVTRKIQAEVEENIKTDRKETLYYNTYENKEIVLHKNNKTSQKEKVNKHEEYVEYFKLNIVRAEVEDTQEELRLRIKELKDKKKPVNSYSWTNSHYSWANKENEKLPSLFDNLKEDEYWSPSSTYNSFKYDAPLPKYGSDFDLDKEEFDEMDIIGETSEFIDAPYINYITAQLLSGNVLLPFNKDIKDVDIDNLAKKVDSIYTRRFGNIKANKEHIETHIHYILDFIMEYYENADFIKDIDKYIEDTYEDAITNGMTVLLYNLLMKITEYDKTGEVIDIIIDILNSTIQDYYKI